MKRAAGPGVAARLTRRALLQAISATGLALAAGCSLPFAPRSDTRKVARVGWLLFESRQSPWFDPFVEGLRELGYVEGRNLVIERRGGDGRPDQLPRYAAELVALPVDVIVAVTATDAMAAKSATSVIPIVFAIAQDPVGSGLTASLARPGGNVTGLSLLAAPLSGKRVEMLKESAPEVSRLAIINSVGAASSPLTQVETQAAAEALGLQAIVVEARAGEWDRLAPPGPWDRVDGLVALPGTLGLLEPLVELAARYHLPAVYPQREFVEAGGLMAYGPNYPDLLRRAAHYVDRILKGAKPADLPVEQPTRFEFVLNAQTASALGLTIPPHVLMQVTELVG